MAAISSTNCTTNSTPPPPPPNSWYGHAVQVITHIKDWITQRIISLFTQLCMMVVKTWFRWKGYENPFNTIEKEEQKNNNLEQANQVLNELLLNPSNFDPSDSSKKTEEILSPSLTTESSPTLSPLQTMIPPFTREPFTANLTIDSEKESLLIDHIDLQKGRSFIEKCEFSRDLLIHAINLSRERNLKGGVQISAKEQEVNLMFRCLDCIEPNKMVKDSENSSLSPLKPTSPFLVITFPPSSLNDDNCMLTLKPTSILIEAANMKKKSQDFLNRNDLEHLQATIKSYKEMCTYILNHAKKIHFSMESILNPVSDKAQEKVTITIDDNFYQFQFSYKLSPDCSELVLKDIQIEEIGRLEFRHQVLCYAKVLWKFFNLSDSPQGKIPITAKRRLFANSALEAKIFSLFDFVPQSKYQELVIAYQSYTEKTKKIRQAIEKQPIQGKLQRYINQLPADSQKAVSTLLGKVNTKTGLKTKYDKVQGKEKTIILNTLRLLNKELLEEYLQKAEQHLVLYKGKIEEALTMDFTLPQEMVPLSEQGEYFWTNNSSEISIQMADAFEAAISEEILFQAKKKTPQKI